MNNNITIFFILTLLISQIWGQSTAKTQFLFEKTKIDSTNNSFVWFNGDFKQNSNSVPNQFLFKFVFPSFIDEETKNNSSNRMNSNNRLGLTLQSELGYSTRFSKNPNITWYFGYGYYDYSAVKFSKDFFELLFRGNKVFEGKTAELSNFELTIKSFQTITLGISKINENKKLSYGFGFGLANGFRNQEMKLNKGRLFTSTSGENLLLDVNGDYHFNERESLANGTGVLTNAWLRLNPNKDHSLMISVKNLGIIRWNNLSRYQKDSSYQFSGLEVGEIFNANDNLVSNNTSTNIQGLLKLKKEKKSYSTLLPFDISLNHKWRLTECMSFFSGIDYYHLIGYVPRIHSGLVYTYSKLNFHSGFAYGGFGGLDYLFGVNFSSRRFFWGSDFQILEPLLLSKSSSGVGMNLNLIYKFK
ncbi:MAG: hypothetical protein SNJ77_11420 [Cytophagales bacterium]